ncbi:MAG: threonylcarbamoyl-AMP synthase [Nitrososphaeria archaeon]|nr:threonylcarbamoyl-AMP synthase [Nitrososphaeria archaeon]NIN51848.1 threonylcarbamoyl-AMP synthase [Nitrososphaeria archaeon]NIQ32370.1 threonylcarbamoyl-AMP synthase [Nitrososphaeria archaeon]
MRINIPILFREDIEKASKIVSQGGLIVYPTDTVYGLGCDPFNIEAVERVFRVKRRGKKPLPVLATSRRRLEEICCFNEKAVKLGDRFWPGKLTLVLEAKVEIPCALKGVTVAVRVPGNHDTLKLIEACGGFLVGTSANLSGGHLPRSVSEARIQLGDSIDLYLDGGPTVGMPSTVVDLSSGRVEVLRVGALDAVDIAPYMFDR